MPKDELIQLSKFLRCLPRHTPDALGLEMDPQGWVAVESIAAGAASPITRDLIEKAVRTSSKRRFSIPTGGPRSRAGQGHSFPAGPPLAPCRPPEMQTHGSAEHKQAALLAQGLKPMQRQHARLSPDAGTVRRAGTRQGKPVVLSIDAARRQADGHAGLLPENRVRPGGAASAAYLRQ
ncbi:RNA 2'-phosphotransferase [Leisingera thetidis]|uniref:RNA 2'-phosphotransferase n=1 Tax=Leisingera thetidis TaxID=2930199 RepID=UPI0021F79F11|nr:RNA 2'-phosphotransferase [Leisingera thetidis]